MRTGWIDGVDAPTELSLFSGVGGGLLGSQWLLGWRTVCYVEWDAYAVDVLKARIRDGVLHDAPIWDNVFTFDGRPWRGLVDIVSAGFPCQPFSSAGKQLAGDDPRNGFPATIRIIREVRPRVAWLENVPGLLFGKHRYFDTVLGELDEAGYDAEWGVFSAAEVSAPHKRERLWILAYAKGEQGYIRPEQRREGLYPGGDGEAWDALPDSDGGRRGQFDAAAITEDARQFAGAFAEAGSAEWWAVEPGVGRVADGVGHRVDRLRGTGNGQVPGVVRKAWSELWRRVKQ